MVLIFKEKRAGIAGLSALTRTRLVQTCGERSRGQEWLSRAHISPWRLCGCPGTALKTFQANRKCPMPTLRLMLQHSPSSSSQLEEECEIYTLRAPSVQSSKPTVPTTTVPPLRAVRKHRKGCRRWCPANIKWF